MSKTASKKNFYVIMFLPEIFFYQKDFVMPDGSLDWYKGTHLIYLRQEIERAGFRFCVSQNGQGMVDVAGILCLTQNFPEGLLANIAKVPKERCFLCLLEPNAFPQMIFSHDPVMLDYFGTIFTLWDEQVDNKVFLKMHHFVFHEERVQPFEFSQKKLCILVQTNRYSCNPDTLYAERRSLAMFLRKEPSFDLFGEGWNVESRILGKYRFPNWRGPDFTCKMQRIRNYKFIFAYEPVKDQPGMITERIFDAFYGAVVPIYWGAPNITDIVPKDCFVDRREFSSNEELYAFMKSMDRKTHERYLNAAADYLQSPFFKKHYSPHSFGGHLMARIKERLQS